MLGLAVARLLFHYRKGQKKHAFGNANVNLNANFFEHELLGLAGARLSSLLQKWTEKTEKNRNLLATLTYLLRQSLSLLCSLTLACFFITEKDRKNRKKQKLLPAAGYGNVNVNANDNYNYNLNANDNVNYNLTGFDLNIFSIYEG